MTNASVHIFAVALAAMWCGFGLYGLARMAVRSAQWRERLERLHRSGPLGQAAALALLVTVVAIGGTKPDGGNQPRNTPNTRNGDASVSSACSVVGGPRFGLIEVRTEGVALRAEPTNAVEAAAWRLRGASEDGIWIERERPFFALGTNPVRRVYASASGALSFESARHPQSGAALAQRLGGDASPHLEAGLAQRLGGDASPHLETALAPFRAPLGILPAANEGTNAAPSRFWNAPTPGGGLIFAWENVLVDRLPGRRATIQAELKPSGDFTYRYDFSDALEPPATNLVIGAQAGTNAVNALAILGTNLLAETVWRVDGARVTNGVSIADLLCTNGALRTPARFALEWRNTSGVDPNADSDGDGLSDWDEVFRHGTDPRRADTDGDSLSDSSEVLVGANPLDADENNDGIPDGVDPAAWAADPIWADNAGKTNLVITLAADIPAGETATLLLGSLALPLRQARAYPLYLPPGQLVGFHLFSTVSGAVPLRIETGEAPMRSRGALRSPPVPVPEFSPAPLWSDDPDGVFDGDARDGSGCLAHPVLDLVEDPGVPGECIHHDGIPSKVWTVSVLPESIGLGADDLFLEGFSETGDGMLSLSVGPTPGDTATGTASLTPPKLRIGELTQTRDIHRCYGYRYGYRCEVCGFIHPNGSCSHEAGCAAVHGSSADCTCEGIYVHVAWQDTDGNGTEDRYDPHLVASADNCVFVGLGDYDADGCCCWDAYENDAPCTARLVSHSGNLRIFDPTGAPMSAGSTSTVFVIQATDVSPSVKGSQVVYELLGRTNNVLRTLHVPVTAWDVWDTGLAFNWATNAHSADAINLRRDYGTDIDYTQGEWRKAMDHAAGPSRDEPACWIAGTTPTIQARFEIRPADIRSAALSAVGFGSILSWIDEAAVAFSNGVTKASGAAHHPDYASFPLALDIPTVVSRSTNELLHWFATSINGHALPSSVFIATNGPGVAYSILDEPKLPWTDADISETNVWVSALDVICSTNWAGGLSSKTSVASCIASSIFSSGKFTYEIVDGESKFLIGNTFMLSRFLRRLKGAGTAEVNCTDCANATVSLANAVGCSLWSSVMGYHFDTNPYCAIGRTPWNPPTWGWGFSYHEVAWDGMAGDSDLVFDACLQYDGDADPQHAPRTASQPVSVPFSDGNSGSPFVYRERLTPAGPDGYESCISRPMEKRRNGVR